MILETIISSLGQDGKINFAPIGVRLKENFTRFSEIKEFELILYPGSQTYANLKYSLEGVVNFTNDISAFVDTALFSKSLPTTPSTYVRSSRMAKAQAFWEFSVSNFDDAQIPALVNGKVLFSKFSGGSEGFTGFCRAHGVILEALIASTRLQWIPLEQILESWQVWQEIVEKTGGHKERETFAQISAYFLKHGISIKGGCHEKDINSFRS